MIVSEIELFEILTKELGKEKAKALVEYVEHKVDKQLVEKTNILSTKEDLAHLEIKLAQLETKLTRAIYVVGLVQYLAILVSVITIVKYVMH
jgi:hypothetical protein